ncbi:hypothetical protein BSL82_10165 [Tardibacter chloracetimidivorans]|uniref:Uncharacterized protein n=1 Tax=Tardibacter chloracetimidivorans TaxID=1921510 RepID=A0A1L3ZVJ2_9SPHN|nr:hypothetical protein [Tardibacter chloracetimidivorans]API59637.1 hypothetical protein BSL82_10165 [Tardibacter chloracetimidivorans]
MASEIDIANLALAHLGDDASVASIDPPEGSPQAGHCARFYPIARDSLLELHTWSFATTTAPLAPLSVTVDGYGFAYALPNKCLRPLKVYEPGGRFTEPSAEFEIEIDTNGASILLTDVPDAILRHVLRISDPGRFSPLFVETLSWLLASMVAGPLVKGESGVNAAKTCWQTFLARLADATESDANKAVARLDPKAPWVVGR